MRLAKSLLHGATLLALAAGSATAGDPPADTPLDSMTTDSQVDAAAAASMMYDVDDDRDGRTDRTLILEQSDSLA